MTVTKWVQQDKEKGYFAALAFRDFGNGGENVYVGGARYYDDDQWVMAIVRCQEADVKDIGSLAHWTLINRDDDNVGFISILHHTDSGIGIDPDYLFGATRNLGLSGGLTDFSGLFWYN